MSDRRLSVNHSSPERDSECVRFINTFQPPGLPLVETVFPALKSCGSQVKALFSRGAYRRESALEEGSIDSVWVPRQLAKRKMWCHIFFWLIAPIKLMTYRRDGLDVFLTQPPFFYILGGLVDRMRGVRYVVHIMDVYPDILSELGVLKSSNPIFKILSAWSIHTMNRAEKVVVIGRCMQERLIRSGVDERRIAMIPNWTPSLVNGRTEAYSFREEYGLDDRFILMYSGNMGVAHEFTTVLEVAYQLRSHANMVFAFIGGGARRKEIEKCVAARGLTNVLLVDFQPIERLAAILAAADLHFISLRKGFEGIMVPSKFYSAYASARPIVYEGNEEGEIARVIRETGCGEVVGHGDVTRLKKVIISYFQGDRGRERVLATHAQEMRFDPEMSARKYARSLLSARLS